MSWNGKYVSIGDIIWRVMRNPICADLTYEQAAEFAIEFLRLIEAPLSFLDSVCSLKLNDYKTHLPANLINIKGVRYTGLDGCCDPIAMRYATDIYHMSHDQSLDNCTREFTYVIQNCILTASMCDGFVDVSYKSIALDDNGFPMIPDNESYKFGLEYFIMHRFLEPLWAMGKIQDKVFQYYEQKRHWYLGQASTALIIQGPDHLESIMNGLNRIIINDQAHETFYKMLGEKERIRKYN